MVDYEWVNWWKSHGFWSSLMWRNFHFAAKQQVTRCFRSLKPFQTGLFMLTCSNIHPLSLPPNAQFGQTWHMSTQLCSGERTGSFCRQLHHCNWPYYLAARFQSPSSVMVSAEPFSDRSWSVPCSFTQMGPCQIINMRLWPAADYEPYCRRMFIDKVWWWTTTTSRSWRWRSQVAEIYSNDSIREINEMKWWGLVFR